MSMRKKEDMLKKKKERMLVNSAPDKSRGEAL